MIAGLFVYEVPLGDAVAKTIQTRRCVNKEQHNKRPESEFDHVVRPAEVKRQCRDQLRR